MGNQIPMEEGACDGCDFKGMVYDHMGDYFCPKCAETAFADPEEPEALPEPTPEDLKALVDDIRLSQNMDVVVELCLNSYEYGTRRQLITALERAWKAGKLAGLLDISDHSNSCLKCGDCSELDAILPETQ